MRATSATGQKIEAEELTYFYLLQIN